MQTKFAVLSLRERQTRPSTALKMFQYEDIEVVDRATAASGLLGGDQEAAREMLDHLLEHDRQAKARGKLGAAVLIIRISTADGERITLLRSMPVILGKEALDWEEMVGWRDLIQHIINEGDSIKRRVAKKEKAGELQHYIN